MRESSEELKSSPGIWALRVFMGLLSFLFFMLTLRVPAPMLLKLGLMMGLVLLVRWLFTFPRDLEAGFYFNQGQKLEHNREYKAAARHYEEAARRLPKNSSIQLRLLAAYHGANQHKKAEALIDRLSRIVFKETEVEELEYLVSKYRPGRYQQDT